MRIIIQMFITIAILMIVPCAIGSIIFNSYSEVIIVAVGVLIFFIGACTVGFIFDVVNRIFNKNEYKNIRKDEIRNV